MTTADTLVAIQSALDDLLKVTPNGEAKRIIIDLEQYLAQLALDADHKRCGDVDSGCHDYWPRAELDDLNLCRCCRKESDEANADDAINQDFYRNGRN